MSRRDRKAQASREKRVAKKLSKAFAKLPQLQAAAGSPEARLAAIEDYIQKKQVADHENLQNLVRALTMVDAHIFVLQRIALERGDVDLGSYYDQLNEMNGDADAYVLWAQQGLTPAEALAAAEKKREEKAAKAAQSEEPAKVELATSVESTTEVFGGDYENG